MDNALIVDGALAVILIVGTLVGAKRGLFKSLMGLVVVAAALVGSVVLANMLTEPITDFVAPKVENAVVKQFTNELDKSAESGTDAADGVGALLEKYGISADALSGVLTPFASGLSGAATSAKQNAADTFRGMASAAIRTVVSGAVHAVLTMVLYIVLLVVLRLLVNLINHVFDLPLLGTVNSLGGAAIGFVEALLLVYAMTYIGYHLGVKIITAHANDTFLLSFFLNHSPVELLSSLTRKA